jgi:hypothetical protein
MPSSRYSVDSVESVVQATSDPAFSIRVHWRPFAVTGGAAAKILHENINPAGEPAGL